MQPKVRPDVGSPEWRMANTLASCERKIASAEKHASEGNADLSADLLFRAALDLQAIIDGDADKSMPHPTLSAEEKSEYVLAAGWLLIGANKAHLAAKLVMNHYRNVSAGSVTSAKYRQLMRAAWTHDGFTAKSDKAKTSSLERTKSLVKRSVALQIEKREKD